MPDEDLKDKAIRAVIAAARSKNPEHILDYLKSRYPEDDTALSETKVSQFAAEVKKVVEQSGVLNDDDSFDFEKFEEYRRKNPKRGEVVQFKPKP